MPLNTPAQKRRYIAKALEQPCSTWTQEATVTIRCVIRENFLRNGARLQQFPHNLGVFAALFREAPVVMFPAREASVYTRFGKGYAWAVAEPFMALSSLARFTLKTLKWDSMVAVVPIPADVVREYEAMHDRRCCIPVALTILTGSTYTSSYAELARLGRRHGHGTHTTTILGKEKVLLGYRFFRLERAAGAPRPTVARWLADHPVGSFLLLTDRHGTAVINGVPHDHTPLRPRARVLGVYLVTPAE